MSSSEILLKVDGLKKYFPLRKGILQRIHCNVRAVDDISFFLMKGETFGLVGESGCGKTTTGRTILRLEEPTGGKILFSSDLLKGSDQSNRSIDIASLSLKSLKAVRQEIQIIFQDPYSSLNPRMTVRDIVAEPLVISGKLKGRDLEEYVSQLLNAVGLRSDHLRRYPYEFSGGQRQRIGIARALAPRPKLIVADEPVSALDVSIQAQVMNLMKDLQESFHLTYLFISHDLSVIKYFCSRIAVMYLGKIVEIAGTDRLFSSPMHPYTEALISAVPVPNPRHKTCRILLKGDVPSPMNPPSGCHFHPRCFLADDRCRESKPELLETEPYHYAACHYAGQSKMRTPAERL